VPVRGQILRESDRGPLISLETGEATPDDSPIWVPWLVGVLKAVIPVDLRDGGPEIQALPAVGCVGPDHVYEYYVFRKSRRVETGTKSYVLGDTDDAADVVAQRGGRPRIAVTVLRLTGDPRTTLEGSVYDAQPCFRFRLDVGPDGEPEPPLLPALGWLVHHRDQRAPKLDIDWDGGVTRSGHGYAQMPTWEVRLDLATRTDDLIYAPRFLAGEVAPEFAPTPSAPRPGASDVLPMQQPKKGLFRRGR
jgi:hypothetical protein